MKHGLKHGLPYGWWKNPNVWAAYICLLAFFVVAAVMNAWFFDLKGWS